MSEHQPDTPDPSALPEGHPLRKLGADLGMLQEGQGAPQGAAEPSPRGPGPQPFRGPQSGSPGLSGHPDPAARPPDPLSRPLTLHSGGLPYGDHDGTVIIRPMRGEQEEILAGAGSGIMASPAFRHVVEQCFDGRGVPYQDLILEDWVGVTLNVLALSLGTDRIPLFPACPTCGTQFDGTRELHDVPCRHIRRTPPGEDPTWPPQVSADEDEDMRVLREMGLAEDAADPHQVYTASVWEEPVDVRLANGQVISWRYLRLKHLVEAEDFAERSNADTNTSTGSKLHRFIQARYIQAIDGRPVGVLEAMRWVRQAPMPLLNELRDAIERRTFGYELSPSFRCPNGHRFRQQLPLDVRMFRERASFR